MCCKSSANPKFAYTCLIYVLNLNGKKSVKCPLESALSSKRKKMYGQSKEIRQLMLKRVA